MATDIIAENQTEQVLSVLDRGEADGKTQQLVLAAILRSLQKQSQRLEEIDRQMWKRSDLETVIDKRHETHCNNCPAKKYVDEITRKENVKAQSGFGKWLSPTVMFFIIAVLSLLSIMYIALGKDGYKDVTGSVPVILQDGK